MRTLRKSLRIVLELAILHLVVISILSEVYQSLYLNAGYSNAMASVRGEPYVKNPFLPLFEGILQMLYCPLNKFYSTPYRLGHPFDLTKAPLYLRMANSFLWGMVIYGFFFFLNKVVPQRAFPWMERIVYAESLIPEAVQRKIKRVFSRRRR